MCICKRDVLCDKAIHHLRNAIEAGRPGSRATASKAFTKHRMLALGYYPWDVISLNANAFASQELYDEYVSKHP